jgi:hypothetical protein
MFDHLITADATLFLDAVPLEDASLAEVLNAQVKTASTGGSVAEWLNSLGAPTTAQAEKSAAQHAFGVLTATAISDEKKKEIALQVHTPEAVKHLTAMLSAYDWEFIQQAKELRGYAVAKILEETKHPEARVRLQALTLLGKVTEVALFTERSEVRHVQMSDTELETKIKEKLARFVGVTDAHEVGEVEDAIEVSNAA